MRPPLTDGLLAGGRTPQDSPVVPAAGRVPAALLLVLRTPAGTTTARAEGASA